MQTKLTISLILALTTFGLTACNTTDSSGEPSPPEPAELSPETRQTMTAKQQAEMENQTPMITTDKQSNVDAQEKFEDNFQQPGQAK